MRVRPIRHESLWVGVIAFFACLAANLWVNGSGWKHDNFELGAEYAHIATALLDGRGYADPFGIGSGPTGWMPPAYTLLLVAVKLATGGDPATWTGANLFVVVALKCVLLGWGAGLASSILRHLRLPVASRLSLPAAWLLAVVWADNVFLTHSTHDSWWLAWVLMLALHGIVSLPRSRRHVSLTAGLVLAAWSSPVLFVASLGMLAMRAMRFPRRWRLSMGIRPAVPAVAAGTLAFVAWVGFVRLHAGIWCPGKTNGGFELWQSLVMTPDGLLTESTACWHPINDADLRDTYRQLGEDAWLARFSHQGFAYVREHPGVWADQVLNRARNALIRMRSDNDSAVVNPKAFPVSLQVAAELETAHLVHSSQRADRAPRFLYLRMTDAQLARFAPRLPDATAQTWKTIRGLYQSTHDRDSFLERLDPQRLLRSGGVTLAWLITLACAEHRLHRRLLIPLACYLWVLVPYILISHYDRYQDILIQLQALALAAAAGLLWERCRRSSTRVSGRGS